jgi:hypothetical protein
MLPVLFFFISESDKCEVDLVENWQYKKEGSGISRLTTT